MKASELRLEDQATIVDLKDFYAKIHYQINLKLQILDTLDNQLKEAETLSEAEIIKSKLTREKKSIENLMSDLIAVRKQEHDFLILMEETYGEKIEFDLFDE